jgi:hypothetical protein
MRMALSSTISRLYNAACALSVLLALGLFANSFAPVYAQHGAATKINFQQLYNRSLSDFQSLQYIYAQHTSFVTHRSNCAGEKSKAYMRTAQRDVHDVQSILNILKRASNKTKKLQVYRDLLRAARELKAWGQKQIVASLGTCKRGRDQSASIQKALTTVSRDLGLSGGY